MLATKVEVGDRVNDPSRHSLRLLPSGPDRVGERPVRLRAPKPLYQLPRIAGQPSTSVTFLRGRCRFSRTSIVVSIGGGDFAQTPLERRPPCPISSCCCTAPPARRRRFPLSRPRPLPKNILTGA